MKNEKEDVQENSGHPWGLYLIVFGSIAICVAMVAQVYLENHNY